MNKKLIGKFLKTLREEKSLTQIQLSSGLFEGSCSDALISKWERGQAVPYIDDLKKLAEYFNVTVDEILNGTRYEEIDFEKKYFIFDNKWMSHYNDDDLYKIREEQELMIETRFKELLRKMVSDGLSLSEDREFDFIVTYFYRIFLPAIESVKVAGWDSCAVEDLNYYDINSLSDIKFEICKQTALMHNSTVEEKFWEANKKFISNKRQNIFFDFCNCIDDSEEDVRNRILKTEDYEKDILLAALQQVNVVHTLAVNTQTGKELYEKQYGHKYDEEQLTKRAIRLLIECGAKLNKAFIGYWQVVTWKHNILDLLEDLHKKYKAPLLVPICENGRYQYYTVKNTADNRAELGIKYENADFDETDYQELERRFYAGERVILKPYKILTSDVSEEGAFLFARNQMLSMSLESYYENRDGKLTEELLADLDELPLTEIREKYFTREFRGEYIDDSHSMSLEDFKKKYYIKDVPNE